MKKIQVFLFLLCFLIPAQIFPQRKANKTVYQTTPIISLLKGVKNGEVSLASIKKHGNFGVGAGNNIDGEIVIYNDTVYQVKIDGKPIVLKDSYKVPFATVTFFHPDTSLEIKNTMDYKQLVKFLDKIIPTKNTIYAIKISGRFQSMKTRSIPLQIKPYKDLNDVIKKQVEFNYNSINGTLVGFRFPSYIGGINVAGYHFHFISDDKSAGGHCLGFIAKNVKVEIEYISNMEMRVPYTQAFYKADLGGK